MVHEQHNTQTTSFVILAQKDNLYSMLGKKTRA